MGSDTIISEVGNGLVKLLRERLVPDVIGNAEEIGLCSPDNKGDLSLSVWLYDIQESEEVFANGMLDSGIHSQRYPSQFLELHYMITAYSDSDIKFRGAQEQKVLGRTAQVFLENRKMPEEYLEEKAGNAEYEIKIEMEKIKVEDKMKVYCVPNSGYKLSLFYKVFPVELESTRKKKVHRVVHVELDVNEAEKGRG